MQFNETLKLNKNEFIEALNKAHNESLITNFNTSIGPFNKIRTENTLLDRFGISVYKLFGDDPKKCLSFMFRFRALLMIIADVPQDYKREKYQDTDEIHEDLIAVACSCPLTKSGKFHKQKFFTALKKFDKSIREKQE